MVRWRLCLPLPILSDFERFLYDKSRKTSDFFEQISLKIARFARLVGCKDRQDTLEVYYHLTRWICHLLASEKRTLVTRLFPMIRSCSIAAAIFRWTTLENIFSPKMSHLLRLRWVSLFDGIIFSSVSSSLEMRKLLGIIWSGEHVSPFVFLSFLSLKDINGQWHKQMVFK